MSFGTWSSEGRSSTVGSLDSLSSSAAWKREMLWWRCKMAGFLKSLWASLYELDDILDALFLWLVGRVDVEYTSNEQPVCSAVNDPQTNIVLT